MINSFFYINSSREKTGKAIPKDIREKMESLFEMDFSSIRIHEDPKVLTMGALAYVLGNDIYFAPGYYAPYTPEGLELLAHELTHVKQQRQGRVKATSILGGLPLNNDPILEQEADTMGKRAMNYRMTSRSSNRVVYQEYQDRPMSLVAQCRVIFTSGGDRLEFRVYSDLADAIVRAFVENKIPEKISEKVPEEKRLDLTHILGIREGREGREGIFSITYAILRMLLSRIDYGIIDITDEHQAVLLYYNLANIIYNHQVFLEEEVALSKAAWKEGDPYKLAFIGSGSGTAYYLNTLSETYNHAGTLIIGIADAWTPEMRGDGYINHQEQLIGQWGEVVPPYDSGYMERLDFAEQNSAAIERATNQGAAFKNEIVVSIRKNIDHTFEIKTIDAESFTPKGTYTAKKVIVSMGAGPHAPPSQRRITLGAGVVHSYPPESRQNTAQGTFNAEASKQWGVVGLDKFMRNSPRVEDIENMQDDQKPGYGKTIIVFGPNAGIDAVERGKELGYDVYWFRTRTGAPAILPGHHLRKAPAVADDPNRYIQQVSDIVISKKDNADILEVNYQSNSVPQTPIECTFFVLSMGQDPFAKGAVGHVLSRDVNIDNTDTSLLTSLQPIYDKNVIYRDKPYKAVLGLQTPGTTLSEGLEIIGASAPSLLNSMSRGNNVGGGNYDGSPLTLGLDLTPDPGKNNHIVKHTDASEEAQNFFNITRQDRDGNQVRKNTVYNLMDELWKQEVASVITKDQLTSVRGGIAAHNGMMPRYITKEVNFATDNRTMLRTYLAIKFPAMTERKAQEFIAKVLADRQLDQYVHGEQNNEAGYESTVMQDIGVNELTGIAN